MTFLQLSRSPSYDTDSSIPASDRRSPDRGTAIPLGPGAETAAGPEEGRVAEGVELHYVEKGKGVPIIFVQDSPEKQLGHFCG